MRTRTSFLAMMLLLGLTILSTATAQVPRMFSYQGLLTDAVGNPVSISSAGVTLSIYDAAFGGSPIHTETQTVSVNNGIFSMIVGQNGEIPASVDFDRSLFLGISIDNGPEMSPRTPLVAVPQAMVATTASEARSLAPGATGAVTSLNNRSGEMSIRGEGNVSVTTSGSTITVRSDAAAFDSVAGGDLSGFYPAPTVSGLRGRPLSASAPSSGDVLKWDGSSWRPSDDEGSVWSTSGSNTFVSSGNVGIGTSSPSERLDVDGRIRTEQLQITSGAASGRMLISDAEGRASWTDRIRTKSSNVIVDQKLGIHLPDTVTPDANLHVVGTYSEFNPVSTRTMVVENKGEVSLSFRSDSGRRHRIYFDRPVGDVGAMIQCDSTLVVIGKHRFTAINGTSQSYRFYFDNDGGRLGIGRYAAENKLEVNGSASKSTAGDWLANSDRRIKTDIRDITNARETLMKLRPVTFNYSDKWKMMHPEVEDRPYYNFIAQEYRQVFPNAVKGSGEYLEGDAEEILQIDTYDSQIVTIKAVQELVEENRELRARLERIEKMLEMTTAGR